jgi:hypothetical protein
MKRNYSLFLASTWKALPAVGFLAALILSTVCSQAAGPTNAAVELTFSEGSGSSTTNAGYLGGTANLDPGTTTNGYPSFTNNVPAGLYAPVANPFSLNMGIVDNSNGGRKVDLTTINGLGGTLGSFIGGMSICGWVNSRDNRVGSGGNRVAFALEAPNGNGFDLMQQPSGALGFNVNQYNPAGPLSSLQMITESSGAATNNWVFFAVTYDPSLTSEQVKFYFGRGDKLAGFDISRTYVGGLSNQIEFTGPLTIGNFSAVESQYSATGTGSRTYRGLIDQVRIYSNVLTIAEIQQAQLENLVVPPVPATILRQPTNVTVTAAPFKTATFTVDAHGSGQVTYQWRTNGVAMAGATNASVTFPADTTVYNGTVLSVLVDNSLTIDPGVLSSNAVLTVLEPPVPDAVILTSADVLYNGTAVFNSWSQSQQINWGLGGSGGTTTTTGRRTFMLFSLGTNLASKAVLKMWNYWGGPPVNGQGRLAEATTRIHGTFSNTPVLITEPPVGANSNVVGFIAPDATNFFAIAPDQVVGPSIGWYEWDITAWYNASRGQTTTIMLRAGATSGFDFPLYEDREGTAFTAGAGGTLTNTGPRIEIFLAPPRFVTVAAQGGNLVMTGGQSTPGKSYVLLRSSNLTTPLSNWTRVVTNQFDSSGNFSVSDPIAPGASQNFYRLLVP